MLRVITKSSFITSINSHMSTNTIRTPLRRFAHLGTKQTKSSTTTSSSILTYFGRVVGVVAGTGVVGFAAQSVYDHFNNPSVVFAATAAVTPIAPPLSLERLGQSLKQLPDWPIEENNMSAAPNVPAPIKRKPGEHAIVRVHLKSKLATIPVTSRYKYAAWTFNGTVPGPMIRARVGDILDLTHSNFDDSGMPHNLDLHAVVGPGGGAPLTNVDMNTSRNARFRLTRPGLFMYHCGAAPVPVHIANGMYGMILVEPEEGLPPVDKEYYVMQSEFYIESDSSSTEPAECNYITGLAETPDAVVFNGREGALIQGGVLKTTTTDKVRLFFGNIGPNLTSSFHIIGLIYDRVFEDGDRTDPKINRQIALTPPGGTSVIEFQTPVPGTYALVDHAIFRMDRGAVGFINASGPERPDLYYTDGIPNPCVGCKLHT